jgi:hypothetical protein
MKDFDSIYLSLDLTRLRNSILPESLKCVLELHWAGELTKAANAYHVLDETENLPIQVRAVLEFDRIWIDVKRGIPFPSKVPTVIFESYMARALLEYARLTWAYWIDYRIVKKFAIQFVRFSLLSGQPCLILQSIFFLGHLSAPAGYPKIGYRLANAIHKLFLLRLKSGRPVHRFCQDMNLP